ncbi:cysteine hydrolase family protein [Nonomuraea insulae]|uniref:Cysteine hydrolase family protein n=1 Tax=Nonomuraea insulae TaxID=1616787 RepID=A0ABW1CFK8_9ACTN
MTHVAGTTPYPWPWHGELDAQRLALLLISCPATSQPGEWPAAPAEGLASVIREAGGLVVDVRVRAGGPAPASGTSVSAPGWDGFYASPLDTLLRRAGRDLLLLAGCCMETGVHSTMRSANDRGYECLLVADATRAAQEDLRAGAVSTIEMSGGIFGAVGATTAVTTALTSKEWI